MSLARPPPSALAEVTPIVLRKAAISHYESSASRGNGSFYPRPRLCR